MGPNMYLYEQARSWEAWRTAAETWHVAEAAGAVTDYTQGSSIN
jgi:hypothetical protein